MAHHGDVARSPSAAAAALSPSLLHGLGGAAAPPAPRVVQRAAAAAPGMTPSPPAPAGSAASTTAVAAEVSLESPRPDGERTANEYVETPFRPGAGARDGAPPLPALAAKGVGDGGPKAPGVAVRASAPHHHALHLPVGPLQHHNNNKTDARTPPPNVRFSTGKRFPGVPPPPTSAAGVVTKQPGGAPAAGATFKKDGGGAGSSGGGTGGRTPGSSGGASPQTLDCSIICPECSRCRCQSCRKPRPLPQCWLCNNMCLVSAETVVDYASCLCCVKGLYYHCVVDYEADSSLADDPCSCGPPRKLSRWGCLGLLSLVLPCLWCYWPARGCVRVAEKCYARYTSQGCRCGEAATRAHAHAFTDAATPQKRLLDSALDF